MPRIRTIKPDFFMSEDIGELTVNSRLLYIALWLHADREGKMKFNPVALKAQCMPYEMNQFDKCLAELCEKGHALIYEVNNRKYLKLPTFTEHQKPHHTEKESELPEPNGDITVIEPLKYGDKKVGKGKGKEGKGKGKESVHDLFPQFWENYPRKENKEKSITAFKNLTKADKETAIEDCKTRYEQTDRQFIPLPTTYIHGKRWNDEKPKPRKQVVN